MSIPTTKHPIIFSDFAYTQYEYEHTDQAVI